MIHENKTKKYELLPCGWIYRYFMMNTRGNKQLLFLPLNHHTSKSHYTVIKKVKKPVNLAFVKKHMVFVTHHRKEDDMNRKYGYARVSTQDQCLDRQIDALTAQGIDAANIYADKISGVRNSRPQLNALKATVESGDTIIVESLNRLGRSSADLISTMQHFEERGVKLISLKESLDFSTAAGKMVTQMLAILAEFERNCIVERVNEGLAAARARGRVGGRPRVPKSVAKKAIHLYESNELTVNDICRVCKISKPTLYKILKEDDLL